ncbi:MAG: Holliday junction branch migration protein RuvA [Leptospirales bacterium]
MIARLWGTVLDWEEESVILRVQDTGYRIHLSPHSHQLLRSRTDGGEVTLWIQYFWNEHLEAPILAGFLASEEQILFNQLRKVPGLGPLSALRLMALPVLEFLRIIRENDASRLKSLKGVGEKTARKILSELRGSLDKMEDLFSPFPESGPPDSSSKHSGVPASISQTVKDVLIRQFGHTPAEAHRLVSEALRRNPALSKTEDLFQEVYRVGSE